MLKFQSDAFSGVKQVLSFFRFMVSILETSAQLPFLKNKIKIMLINQSINFKKNDNLSVMQRSLLAYYLPTSICNNLGVNSHEKLHCNH